jgi:hypothetical protein
MFSKRIAAAAASILLSTACGDGHPGATASSAQDLISFPSYSLVPIYFVPTDWSVSSSGVQQEAAALSLAISDVQKWYQSKLGYTWIPDKPLQLVQANSRKETYGITWNGRDIYADGINVDNNVFMPGVFNELMSRGYPLSNTPNGYKVVIWVKGAGGWAGSNVWPNGDGGFSILGDWNINGITYNTPASPCSYGGWCGVTQQHGALAHEIGHQFHLPHPDAYNGDWSATIMGNWWLYPNIGFDSYDLNILNNQDPHAYYFKPPTAACGAGDQNGPGNGWCGGDNKDYYCYQNSWHLKQDCPASAQVCLYNPSGADYCGPALRPPTAPCGAGDQAGPNNGWCGSDNRVYYCYQTQWHLKTDCLHLNEKCTYNPNGADYCSACGGPICGTNCCAAGSWCGSGGRCCTGCGTGCPC